MDIRSIGFFDSGIGGLTNIAGAPVIKYGVFVNAIINFLLIAFIIFLFVRSVNKIRKKEVKEAEITTKECPFCKSEIALEASRCPHCTSELAK